MISFMEQAAIRINQSELYRIHTRRKEFAVYNRCMIASVDAYCDLSEPVEYRRITLGEFTRSDTKEVLGYGHTFCRRNESGRVERRDYGPCGIVMGPSCNINKYLEFWDTEVLSYSIGLNMSSREPETSMDILCRMAEIDGVTPVPCSLRALSSLGNELTLSDIVILWKSQEVSPHFAPQPSFRDEGGPHLTLKAMTYLKENFPDTLLNFFSTKPFVVNHDEVAYLLDNG